MMRCPFLRPKLTGEMDRFLERVAGRSPGYCRVLKGRGVNWGTLRIPKEDWGTLGKITGITTPPLKNPTKT